MCKKTNGTRNESFTFVKFFKVTRFVISILWKIAPIQVIMLFIFRILIRLESYIYAIIFGLILDIIITELSATNPSIDVIKPYLLWLFGYIAITRVVYALERYSRRYIQFNKRGNIMLLLSDKCKELGVRKLEDPDVTNKLETSKSWLPELDIYLNQFTDIVAYIIAFIVTGFAVFEISLIVPLAIIILGVIQFIPKKHFRSQNFHWQVDQVEEKRMSWQDYEPLITPAKNKEVEVLGAHGYLRKRYYDFWTYFNKGLTLIYVKQTVVETIFDWILNAILILGYFFVVQDAFIGFITIGSLTVLFQALRTFNYSLSQVFVLISNLSDYGIKQIELIEFFNLKSRKDGNIKLPRLKTPPSVSIKDVSFKYPNTDNYIFKNLNLDIKSGEKIAIVGHNGAGKTTLIKLIARIYSLDKGQININDHNLEDLKLDDWYKNIGILFQEYNFYEQLTAGENIFIGKSIKEIDKDKVIESAKMSDAHDFIKKYDLGYEQGMSERFKDGIRPSTGQKQKIAIARFFYRNAPLAIFDEPTAAIDAVSEYNIFNEIYRFFENKTVIIISHRFSTVRNADRIIVMDEGKIVEQGSHDELMNIKGKYENAFTLQAEGYNS